MPTGHMCAKAQAAVRLGTESLLCINWFYWSISPFNLPMYIFFYILLIKILFAVDKYILLSRVGLLIPKHRLFTIPLLASIEREKSLTSCQIFYSDDMFSLISANPHYGGIGYNYITVITNWLANATNFISFESEWISFYFLAKRWTFTDSLSL